MAELTEQGITIDRLADLTALRNEFMLEEFGQGFDLTDNNPIIRANDITLARLAQLEEAAEAVYFSQFPSSAKGQALDWVCSITGVKRRGATKSTNTAYAAGSAATFIEAGKFIAVEQAGDLFETTQDVTLSSIADETLVSLTHSLGLATGTTSSPHSYVTGDVVFIVGADQEEYLGPKLITGTPTATTFEFSVSTGAVSPATGTIQAKYGTPLPVQAAETGPIQALAFSLNIISTAVAGWDLVGNVADATVGTNIETDPQLRLRRNETLELLGGGTIPAIRGALLNTDGVTGATVFENDTGEIGPNLEPPYSIICLVQGGTDEDIATTLLNSKGAGVPTFGTEGPITVTDADGQDKDYFFSRLTTIDINVYMKILKETDPNNGPLYPALGDDDIRASILKYSDSLVSGEDIKVSPYVEAAIGAVPGVDILELYVVRDDGSQPGDPANPGDLRTTIPISIAEIGDFDSAKIWINGALP